MPSPTVKTASIADLIVKDKPRLKTFPASSIRALAPLCCNIRGSPPGARAPLGARFRAKTSEVRRLYVSGAPTAFAATYAPPLEYVVAATSMLLPNTTVLMAFPNRKFPATLENKEVSFPRYALIARSANRPDYMYSRLPPCIDQRFDPAIEFR